MTLLPVFDCHEITHKTCSYFYLTFLRILNGDKNIYAHRLSFEVVPPLQKMLKICINF